ncbi:MAG: hypothetical protein Barrevirus9_9 [Barrevirus sp.]|uniref:Uncharacterized protein n=1 Tax=Barrevirus sp. TaxID=2487763 RepID=A0A3G4ZQ63_9VIRU|nr:MAG: hypothetical protein Barrevirus9_9 [Barrevirus sp.]
MSALVNAIQTIASPINSVASATLGINAIPQFAPDKVLVYTDCVLNSNISTKYKEIGMGTYTEGMIAGLHFKDIVGIRPGQDTKVTIFNQQNQPFVITHSMGDQCLPDLWKNQLTRLIVERVNPVLKEGFTASPLATLLNILIFLLILFIIYRLVLVIL